MYIKSYEDLEAPLHFEVTPTEMYSLSDKQEQRRIEETHWPLTISACKYQMSLLLMVHWLKLVTWPRLIAREVGKYRRGNEYLVLSQPHFISPPCLSKDEDEQFWVRFYFYLSFLRPIADNIAPPKQLGLKVKQTWVWVFALL